MAQRWWQWWQKAWRGPSTPWAATVVGPAGDDDTEEAASRLVALGKMLLGLLLAWVVGWGVVSLNRSAGAISGGGMAGGEGSGVLLRGAWSHVGDGSYFPADKPGEAVTLPDEWARTRAGYKGSVWYRFHFEPQTPVTPDKLLAAYIDRACSAVEVQLNGQVLYRSGRLDQPVARQCYQSHIVPLPNFLLRSGDNQLDIKVLGHPLQYVSARQRAGPSAGNRRGPSWSESRYSQITRES